MIRRVSASAASSDARSFAADDRSRRLHDRERSVETRRRELLTAIMALVYCCTKSCDACGRSAEHFYTIPADNRYDCALAGSQRLCDMPTTQTLLEAMRFFGVRMRRIATGRRTNVGLLDSRGLFSGILGELQRREFDVHLSDMALELQRFQSFLFMETAYVTNLDFVYAVPTAVVGPGPVELAAILPLRLWLFATAAAMAVAAVTTVLRIAPRERPPRRMAALASECVSLALKLVALCFGQPLGWRDDLLLTRHQDRRELSPLCWTSLKYGRHRGPAACATKFNGRLSHSRRCAARLLLSVWLLSVVALLTVVQSRLISRLRYPPAPYALDSVKRLREALTHDLVRPCLVSKTGSAEYVLQSHAEEQVHCRV
ncbi:hypothetical protein HPB50_025321 [Hyalomma asiaticum]|uniref:Uncharacterized protein n=1 Tax=Hyalomma asiaticum TaxID=266040 RepID=A0ACB7SPB5_HYAAI|nr:hypothetical protein HPB50_025321 [Hyalomma asiaticum]